MYVLFNEQVFITNIPAEEKVNFFNCALINAHFCANKEEHRFQMLKDNHDENNNNYIYLFMKLAHDKAVLSMGLRASSHVSL